MTFYDLVSFEVACRLGNLKNSASALCCSELAADPMQNLPTRELLCIGDVGGSLTVFELKPFFNLSEETLLMGNMLNEINGILSGTREQVHRDWVTKVKFVPDLDLLVTASLDSTIQLYDVHKRVMIRKFTRHRSGVRAFDWCQTGKFIVSGGISRSLQVWNPYTVDSMATLDGHAAPVVDVVVDDNNSGVISVSLDKMLKCWDVSTLRCIQTVMDESVYRPDDQVHALFWDAAQVRA